MGSSRYSIKLFVYLIILSLLGFSFFWSLNTSQLIITKSIVGILFIAVFSFLLRYLNKTNRDLIKFLEAIKYKENVSSTDSADLSFDQLNITFNEITNQLKNAWLDKELEHQYFHYTMENIDVGIISFDKTGKVEFSNKAAKTIFGIESLDNIHDLNSGITKIGEELNELKPGNSKILKIDSSIDQLQVLAKATNLKLKNKSLKIISLQDIKTQLEQSELEAWQKLIKVLTHEIMNSVTPIKSLTYSMQKLLQENEKQEGNEVFLKGLNAIEKRSKGLLEFVQSYKNLTQIQKPKYERVYIEKLVESVVKLMDQELIQKKVSVKIDIESTDTSVIADEKLVSQVLVNLILNSLKAFNKTERILKISSRFTQDKNVIVTVEDNGKGISPEVLDKIFVPFYSTYEDGSGIGLSLARQVMVLHNGRIDVQSVEGEGTIFTLTF